MVSLPLRGYIKLNDEILLGELKKVPVEVENILLSCLFQIVDFDFRNWICVQSVVSKKHKIWIISQYCNTQLSETFRPHSRPHVEQFLL